ncbi:MAG: bifunctional riboflavin kinase/FAD synthetase [Saprospiraceae bacterium]|nr:bifunctional riboflavin kinase/FAD synthetase [Saprospiraceae bacterium]
MQVHKDLNALPAFRRTVVTIGSFDGVHAGHRRILDRVTALARQSDAESVVITFEPHPRTVLHPQDTSFKCIDTTAEKLALLAQTGVDHVVLAPFSAAFAAQTPETYVESFLLGLFHPRYIVIGYDHRFGRGRSADINFLRRYERDHDLEVVEIPAQEIDDIAVSSTKIRRAMESADILHANQLLGRPFEFSGTVVAGERIGRTIGFPTANLNINDPHKLIPPPGIYAARAHCAQGAFDAMLYIGDRPTIENPNHPGKTIEVNLLDFNGDLYGQTLRVQVIDFIRHDKKLNGLEELKAQIERDKMAIGYRLSAVGRRLSVVGDRLSVVGSGPSAVGDANSEANTPPQTNTPQPTADDPQPTPDSLQPTTDSRQPTTIAVVILNYNTRRHLEAYLPSVIAHSPGARVVVADNGSPDDSVAFLRDHYPGVEVIDLKTNYGFARGYNEALTQVKADVYVVLNSDVEVTAGWMEPILEAMAADPTIAVAQPKILAWREKDRFEYAGASGGWIDALGYPFCRGRIFHRRELDTGQYDAPSRCFWASGAAFFIRAELYHAFGGFDGDYFAHNEEIDLCWRLQRAGYSIWCFPQSVVYHLGGGTLEYESPRKVYLNFRNSLYSLLKNEPWGKLAWLIPARLVLDGLAGVRFLLKGQFRAIRAIVQAHFAFYATWSDTVRKRKEVAAIVAQYRIGPEERRGIYRGSIVFAHYARRIMRFSELRALNPES